MALSKSQLPGRPQHFLECGIEDCERNCEFYCNLCHTRLCKQCRDEHLRSPETKRHEVVLYQQRKRQLPTEKCKIHPTKDIELLCDECKIPICSKCTATQEHRGHTFTDLESIYTEMFSHCQREIAKIHEYFLPTSQDLQREINEDTKEIKKIMDKLRTSMKAEAESLKCMVDSVTSENMEEVNKIEQSLLEKLNNQDTTIEKYITYLNDLDKKFHVYMSSLKPTKLVTAEDMQFQPIPDTRKPVVPIFTAGKCSKKDVAKLLGQITFPNIEKEMRRVQPLESKIPSHLKSTSYVYQVMEDSQQLSNIKQTLSLSSSVTEVREFNVPGVKKVFHISQDQSDRLWVSDRNGNLVQTDLQGNQIQKIKTSGVFGYHTVTQNEDLIFTVDNKKVINRITQDNNITEFIRTDWVPCSIHSSHINGDILVGMMMGDEAKLTRYNKTGKELQNIERDNKGQGLYSQPFYITENINGDICTSDYEKEAVVVVIKSGQHRFSYTGQESGFIPLGICTDVLGHILVCDINNVHLLDQDGQFLSLLVTRERGIYPISVCVDDENILYVGQNRNNTVIVIKYLQSMNIE
ncbi:uncharacterized protein LOC133190962 [Saccostrea echinata]|uniref:uncharacterized protein LOC133190962 n=1 Tax=Saccostrea echinata TaxID=191078 RepID=UPI002A822A63|nr:uncharacterized protein LOC133190962 [Saccostrea echinata]